MTHLTSQCACRNSVNSDRSEDVSGSTDCATSPGFHRSVLRANSVADETWRAVGRLLARNTGRRTCLDQMGPSGIAAVRTAADPTFRGIAPPSTAGEG